MEDLFFLNVGCGKASSMQALVAQGHYVLLMPRPGTDARQAIGCA